MQSTRSFWLIPIFNPVGLAFHFATYLDLGKSINFCVMKFILLKLNEIIHKKQLQKWLPYSK